MNRLCAFNDTAAEVKERIGEEGKIRRWVSLGNVLAGHGSRDGYLGDALPRST